MVETVYGINNATVSTNKNNGLSHTAALAATTIGTGGVIGTIVTNATNKNNLTNGITRHNLARHIMQPSPAYEKIILEAGKNNNEILYKQKDFKSLIIGRHYAMKKAADENSMMRLLIGAAEDVGKIDPNLKGKDRAKAIKEFLAKPKSNIYFQESLSALKEAQKKISAEFDPLIKTALDDIFTALKESLPKEAIPRNYKFLKGAGIGSGIGALALVMLNALSGKKEDKTPKAA